MSDWFNRRQRADTALTEALKVAREHAQYWRELAIERGRRVDELTDRLNAMQRDGYRPRQVEPVAPDSPELPDEIVEAIRERGGGLGTDLARQLEAYALGELMANRKPEQIATELWNGVTS